MLNRITELLINKGYKWLNDDNRGILYRETACAIYAVTLSHMAQRINVENYTVLQNRVVFLLSTKFQKRTEILHLVLAENGLFEQEDMRLVEELSNMWFVTSDTGKVYIYENQILDFDDLYPVFDRELPRYAIQIKNKHTFHFTPVNLGIVILNIVFFLVVIFKNGSIDAVYDSEIMSSMGALSYDTFVGGAWYQIITSFFLHFGISHLLNNMVLLVYIGCELERRIGSIAYFLIYFLSGIVGNIASLIFYNYQGEQVVSAGASGAIFGVIGALFVILVVRQAKTTNLSPVRLLIMAGITIYYGITSAGVDNAAHIGGLFAGIIGGFLLSKISRYGKLK